MGREPLGPPQPGGVPPAADEPGGPDWPYRVEDRIRNLKQLSAILGVIAALALGVALWALLDDDESGGGQNLNRERVSQLSERVNELEDKAESNDTSEVEQDLRDKADTEDVEQLRNEVEELGARVEESGGGNDTAEAVDQLGQRVDDLEQRIEDLEAEQQP